VLEGECDGVSARTLHGWRRMVADDVVHESVSWQVHWKYG
jgi:hypothetical protein